MSDVAAALMPRTALAAKMAAQALGGEVVLKAKGLTKRFTKAAWT
jgi:hypothetical protein